MIDVLTDAGFDLPRVGKAYLTAQDPETGERWRLKGEIFHEDWQADPAEREIERGTRHDTRRLRRLDGIPAGELQDRFDSHCDRRAAYHRERYAPLPEREQELVRDTDRADQALADDLALGDLGADRDGDRLDDGRELVLDGPADALGDGGAGPDADRPGGRDLADAGPQEDRVEDLHTGRDAGDLYQDRGEMNDDTPDSLGTRLARLRRAVGDGLRNLSAGIERLGSALDEEAASPVGWYRGLRDVAHTLADRVNAGVAWLAERRSHLQRAGREVERELELCEGGRREAETELEGREREMDRGLTHGL